MILGYARISTDDQNLDLQRDALLKTGCERVFEDTASGSRTERTGLAALLASLRRGGTVVIWRVGPVGAEGDADALGWNDEGGADDTPAALPHALDVLRFLLSGDPSLQWRGDGTAWHWRRNA